VSYKTVENNKNKLSWLCRRHRQMMWLNNSVLSTTTIVVLQILIRSRRHWDRYCPQSTCYHKTEIVSVYKPLYYCSIQEIT